MTRRRRDSRGGGTARARRYRAPRGRRRGGDAEPGPPRRTRRRQGHVATQGRIPGARRRRRGWPRGSRGVSAGLAASSGHSVSASRWSVWLWLDVTTSMKSSRSGRPPARSCGRAACRSPRTSWSASRRGTGRAAGGCPSHWTRKPPWPSHHRRNVAVVGRRPAATSASSVVALKGSITASRAHLIRSPALRRRPS